MLSHQAKNTDVIEEQILLQNRLGYARVSSTREGRQDTITQKKMLSDAGVTEIFEERGSGAKTDRVERERLIQRALDLRAAGEEVEVVVVRLDRWSRSLTDLLGTLTTLDEAGVRFRSLTEAGICLDGTPTSKLILSIIGATAEFERSLLTARIREAKAAKGPAAIGGRPRALTSENVALAQRMLGEGLSMAQVGRQFGVSKSTVSRAVARVSLAA